MAISAAIDKLVAKTGTGKPFSINQFAANGKRMVITNA